MFRTGRQIEIQTLNDTQTPSRLPDSIWNNTKTVVGMKLDDIDEIFFLVRKKVDSDPFVRNNPPRVLNLVSKSPFFGSGRSITIDELMPRLKAGYCIFIQNRTPYFMEESSACPNRTFHRRIGDDVFPNINRVSREEIINKIGLERIDFTRYAIFDDMNEEVFMNEREKTINMLKDIFSKEIDKELQRGDKQVWIREKLIILSDTDFNETEKATILKTSQSTISRISKDLRNEGLI